MVLSTSVGSGLFMCMSDTASCRGLAGGFAYNTSDVVGEMYTKKGIMIINTGQETMGYLYCYDNNHLLFPVLAVKQ